MRCSFSSSEGKIVSRTSRHDIPGTPFSVDIQQNGGDFLTLVYPNGKRTPNLDDYGTLLEWLRTHRAIQSTIWSQAALNSTTEAMLVEDGSMQQFTFGAEGRGVLGSVCFAVAGMTFGPNGHHNDVIAQILAQFTFGSESALRDALITLGTHATFTTFSLIEPMAV